MLVPRRQIQLQCVCVSVCVCVCVCVICVQRATCLGRRVRDIADADFVFLNLSVAE